MRRVVILLLIFWLACGARGAMAQTMAEPDDTGVKSPTINCDYLGPETEKEACRKCILEKKSSWTVFGCLPTSPEGFVMAIMKLILGLGGGTAFLAMIYGGFNLLTSGGSPERINEGKKLVFYSGMGLLVIIFSVFILQLVGVQVLGIPQYGR